MRKSFLLLALCPLSLFAAETNFTHAVYSEVIKDVNTVYGASGKTEKAASGKGFTSQDFVKSGRGSRAQLTIPDGTIIRVGPNAVFSLDKTSRQIKLQGGSILFYSPPGAGGGKIVTDSVTCAVTGTTIIVTVDPETKRFTLQVLEGHVTLTNKDGQSINVDAGEKVSIPFNYSGPLTTQVFATAEVTSAILINGFSSTLPSVTKIVDTLGGLPGATPTQIRDGVDTGISIPANTQTTADGTSIGTQTPAAAGQAVIPNVSITGAPVSPNGEGSTL